MQMASSLKFMLSNNEDTAINYTERVLGQELANWSDGYPVCMHKGVVVSQNRHYFLNT